MIPRISAQHCLPRNSIGRQWCQSSPPWNSIGRQTRVGQARCQLSYVRALFHYHNVPACIWTLRHLVLKWRSDNSATFFSLNWRLLRHRQAGPRIIKWRLQCRQWSTVSQLHEKGTSVPNGQEAKSFQGWSRRPGILDFSINRSHGKTPCHPLHTRPSPHLYIWERLERIINNNHSIQWLSRYIIFSSINSKYLIVSTLCALVIFEIFIPGKNTQIPRAHRSQPTAEAGYGLLAVSAMQTSDGNCELRTSMQEEESITSKGTFRKAGTFPCPKNTLWPLK
jgi:hypothetical protein